MNMAPYPTFVVDFYVNIPYIAWFGLTETTKKPPAISAVPGRHCLSDDVGCWLRGWELYTHPTVLGLKKHRKTPMELSLYMNGWVGIYINIDVYKLYNT